MSTNHFTVREATQADIPAVAALGADLVRLHVQFDAQRFEILAPELEAGYARFLRSRLNDPQAVVLVADFAHVEQQSADADSIAGYAFGQVEGPSWPDLLGVHGRFHDLLVRADRRREGVGEALVRGMTERLRARGAPRVVLMTAWANSEARAFFSKLGFRPTMVEMTSQA